MLIFMNTKVFKPNESNVTIVTRTAQNIYKHQERSRIMTPPLTEKDFLKEMLSIFRKRNQKKMRKLNDKILRQAVISFSKEFYELAIICYVLAKILSKPRYTNLMHKPILLEIEKKLENASRKPKKELRKEFQSLKKTITSLDQKDSRYVTGLITKGRIKTAAILYAQGLSLGIAAETAGIDKQEIMAYAGITRMFDRLKEKKDLKQRLKELKGVMEND